MSSWADTEGGNPSIKSDVDVLLPMVYLEGHLTWTKWHTMRHPRITSCYTHALCPMLLRLQSDVVSSGPHRGGPLSHELLLGNIHFDLLRLRLLGFWEMKA